MGIHDNLQQQLDGLFAPKRRAAQPIQPRVEAPRKKAEPWEANNHRSSIHEAAHAAYALSRGASVKDLKIDWRGSGHCIANFSDRHTWAENAGFYLVGAMAESLLCGHIDNPSDVLYADHRGFNNVLATYNVPEDERAATIERAQEMAKETITRHEKAIRAIAGALESKGRLTGQQIREIWLREVNK